MLVGLSPSRLAVINTMLACVVAGGLGVLVAPLVTLDAQTLAFQVVPALAAALLAGFTSFFIACFAGLAMGAIQWLLVYWQTQSWFPTDVGGAPLRGCLRAVRLPRDRARALPARGEPARPRRARREAAAGRAPARSDCSGRRRIASIAGAVCLIVLPIRLPAGLDQLAARDLICLSLVVIIGFVGQISVVQLALAGVAGFTMSHLTTDVGGIWARFPISLLIGASAATIIGLVIAVSALRVRGVSLAVVTLAAAVALEQFGFLNARWGGGPRGSPVEQPEIGGLNLAPDASFRGIDDELPSPSSASWFSRRRPARPAGRERPPVAASGSGCWPCARTSALLLRPGSTSATRSSPASASPRSSPAWPVRCTRTTSARSATAGSARSAALGLIAFAYFGGITMVSGAVIAGIGATEGLFPHAFDEWFG